MILDRFRLDGKVALGTGAESNFPLKLEDLSLEDQN